MINQCLTGKTSGHDRPRYPVLQMLWGIITITNVDYAELMWEEFIQAIQTFLTDKANLGSPTKKGRKYNPHVIPYSSPFHLTEEDLRLGNLKFVSKGKVDEVFGMPIPNELISNNIKNAPYYNAYLEMVAKHDQKIAAEKEGKKKLATVKQLKPKLAKEISSKPVAATKPKVTKEKPSKPSYVKHPKRGKVQKLCKGKPSLQLIDEDEPTQPEPEPEHQVEGEEYDVEQATRPLPAVEGKGKSIATDELAAQSLLALHKPKRRSTIDQFIFQRWIPVTKEYPFPADAKTGADTDKTNSGGDTKILQIGEE
ncbi:hypothetical protein Tco_1037310 [Tanacetum coccineum]